ncbi:MAG: response regulator transcription factor [Lachnospiraceae bacterium]|nr:response regulator transcription factor [Candidatus Colinaster equi]
MAYRVLIVDDQTLPRQYFESIVNSSDNYVLVASIASATVADAYCINNRVDLIIMDIVMSEGISGLEAAERIKRSYPTVKILMVTSMPDSDFLSRAREMNVDSFWYKEVQDAPMLEVMDRTMAGEHIWPDHAPTVKLGLSDSSEFTDKELEVLRYIAMGHTNQEIADELMISVNTVRFHLTNLLSKTGCNSKIELAILATKSGLVVPNS